MCFLLEFQADLTPESRASLYPGSAYMFKPDKPIFFKKGTIKAFGLIMRFFKERNAKQMTAKINIYGCFGKGTTSKCGW